MAINRPVHDPNGSCVRMNKGCRVGAARRMNASTWWKETDMNEFVRAWTVAGRQRIDKMRTLGRRL